MKLSRAFQISGLAIGPMLITNVAFAQFGLPKLPGLSKKKDDAKKDDGKRRKGGEEGPAPPGVPVPPDSPIFKSFGLLGQQTVYHQRMTLTADDPLMQQMMAQAGLSPAETTTAGDTKQVSMHFKFPVAGGPAEDFELRAVVRNGQYAKKWVSPASERIVRDADAKLAKALVEQEESAAKSIAHNLAMGPMGLASAAASTGAAAANVAALGKARKTVHDFFEWTCGSSGASSAPMPHSEPPPPLTDLRDVGEQTVDGVKVASYEFYVHQDGKFHGPIQMFVAKDSGLPMRIGITDPRMGGGMHMDYYGFNQGGDFEIPACLAEVK